MSNSWLYDLVQWCVQEGREEAANWVAWAAGRSNVPKEQLAKSVAYQQSQLAGHASVTPAAVGSIPGLRAGISAGQISADVGFVMYRMVKSILYQATVYGHDQEKDVIDRILLTLGLALGDDKTRRGMLEGGSRAPARIIASIAGRGGTPDYASMLAFEIAAKFHGRGQLQHLPIVGRPFFGAQNFIYISVASLAGRYVFNDLELAQEELDDLDERMRAWSRTVLGLMMWMARADGNVDGAETETIKALEHSLLLPGIRPEDLETEMQQAPNWERIRKQFRTEDERAGLLENLLMVVWADGVKTDQEDRLCRRVAAELVADRMVDDIEMAVRQSLRQQAEAE